MTAKPNATDDRVEVSVHRTVRVLGADDKPAFELANVNGEVTIRKITTSTKRVAVKLADLVAAVDALHPSAGR